MNNINSEKGKYFFFFLFYFKAKSRIIRNNKNFFILFFSMVCLTLNIFILSTVFVHSILYHVILKCSFLSRLTKLYVVRNVIIMHQDAKTFFVVHLCTIIFTGLLIPPSLFNNLFIYYFHKKLFLFFLPLL